MGGEERYVGIVTIHHQIRYRVSSTHRYIWQHSLKRRKKEKSENNGGCSCGCLLACGVDGACLYIRIHEKCCGNCDCVGGLVERKRNCFVVYCASLYVN